MYRMTFAVTITPDGLYHVQNGVAGMLGQHHVHSKEGFEAWRKPDDDIRMGEGACACGLGDGDVRDHTGRVGRLAS